MQASDVTTFHIRSAGAHAGANPALPSSPPAALLPARPAAPDRTRLPAPSAPPAAAWAPSSSSEVSAAPMQLAFLHDNGFPPPSTGATTTQGRAYPSNSPPPVVMPPVETPGATRARHNDGLDTLSKIGRELLACPTICARRAADGCDRWLDADNPSLRDPCCEAAGGCCQVITSPFTACGEWLARCFGRDARRDCTCTCDC